MKNRCFTLAGLSLLGLAVAGIGQAAEQTAATEKNTVVKTLSDAERNELLAPGPVKQSNFEGCVPDFSPGEKYKTVKRGFQGCPTILRTPKGTLYAGWVGGGPGEGLLNYTLLAKSTNNGITWSQEPLAVIPSKTESKVQALDPEFWLDPQGRFWWFWAQRDYKYHIKDPRHVSVWAMVCDNPDAEKMVWSTPRYISPGFLRNQPTVLSDGRWILCAYDWVDDYYRYTETSDQGKTWYRRLGGKKYPTNFDETMVVERKDGSLWMLARTRYGSGALAESISVDGGKSWSDGKLTGIPDPGSRFYIGRLHSGRLLLINNHNAKERYDITAQLSDDDGRTWKYKFLLDARCCTYPDAVQTDTGEIYIIHDHSRVDAKEILLHRLTEKDIIKGRNVRTNLPTRDSYSSHIINKAPFTAQLSPEEKALFDKFRRKPKPQKTPVKEESEAKKIPPAKEIISDSGVKQPL